MKESLRGKQHASDKEVRTAVMKWLKEQSTEFYAAGIHALIRMWNIAIERNDDYVEKLGCDPQRTSFILIYDIYSYIYIYIYDIMPVLKKNGLLFNSLSYTYIYIYI